MAIHAAEKYGAEVVNYGLVPEQNQVMHQRLAQKKLVDRGRIVEQDHRELLREPDAYDRYVSVGVYEHAGRNCQSAWIQSIATALKPCGIGMISTTGYIDRFATELLTIKYVFPGGSVPSLPTTLELLEKYGLHVVDVEELSWHYQRTAEHWLANFQARWPEIHAIDPRVFTERFRRIWNYYLCGVVEGFRPGGGNLNSSTCITSYLPKVKATILKTEALFTHIHNFALANSICCYSPFYTLVAPETKWLISTPFY
jgi:cyclopropane-fatty-acyl-phospholipid synthase